MGFFNVADFLISIFPFALKQRYDKHFQESAEALSEITKNVKNHLSIFSSKILSVIKENEKFYSEPLSFYYYLTYLGKQRIKLDKYDFGELLSDFQINADFNTLSVKYDQTTKYVAIYTIELVSEVGVDLLDAILQCNSQFIISEFLTFVSAKQALSKVKNYKNTLKSVKNIDIAKELYIDEVLNFDKGLANDFCASQINIALHSDDYNDLQGKIEDISEKFSSLGLKIVREDFNLQTTFFSNLPGNTFYNNRAGYLPTLYTVAFGMIHSKKMGSYNGSKWGRPVTILKTLRGSYYNFNFHYKDNGNTIIIGPDGTGKTTLTHFLLAQSLKFDVNIIYIDLEGRSENFINTINGKVVKLLKNQKSPIQIDLLSIDNYEGNSDWMADLLLKICAKDDLYRYNNKDYIAKFKSLAGKLAGMKDFDKRMNYMENFIEQFDDLTIKTNYKSFFKSEFFNKFFQKDVFSIFSKHRYLSIDLSELFDNRLLFDSFLGLLLAKISKFLTGKKTIIVVNHVHNIFDAYVFKNQMSGWLKKLTKNNAMALLAQENIENTTTNNSIADVMPFFASQLYLSDRMIDKDFKYIFGLSNQEFNYIKSYDKNKHRFLIKHGDDSVFAEVNLSGLKEVLSCLC